MPKQLKRISPHQTAKVAAVLMAVGSLPFVVLFTFVSTLVPFPGGQAGPAPVPGMMFLVIPIMYLILGYVFTAAGCWFYNLMYPFIGGIELEFEDKESVSAG
jgi:hypothetical protein